MGYLIGIDISTTATKALLIDSNGHLISVASTEYTYDTPRPLWSEQHPHLWWDGTVESIKGVMRKSGVSPEQIKGIGLTGQMHGLVLLDKSGQVLRPAILWNDQRTGKQCEEIRQIIGQSKLIQITGNDALAGFTAPKIVWVRENEPKIFARVHHILLPKDYVRYRLTGEYAMDMADGSGTILMALNKREWSSEVLEALNILPEWLPPLYEGPEITGMINSEAARQTGLIAGTPVIAGGGDQAAQAVGVGAVYPGIIALTLGTSGVVFATTGEPFIEPAGRLHAFCHAVPDTWHLMGVMLSAGGSLRWYRDTLAQGTNYDRLLLPAGSVPPGSDGLIFLPYLTGERTPYPDPLARGAFIGLTVRHSLPHMTRSVLEGVAFGLRDSFELIKSAGLGSIRQVRISGGGSRSDIWRQIIADILDIELVTVNTTEGAAYGAALLAGVGAGEWDSVLEACELVIQITSTTKPDPVSMKSYQDIYRVYNGLYPALKPSFNLIGKLPDSF